MVNYSYTPLYYTALTKVRFYDSVKKQFLIGVAYRDFICDEKGKKNNIDEVIKKAEEQGIFFDDAVVELAWD